MNAIDLSADFGHCHHSCESKYCAGVLIAVRYSPVRSWPHLRFNIFRLHNRTAYLLVVAIVLHPVILLFSATAHFRLVDFVLPIWCVNARLRNFPREPQAQPFAGTARRLDRQPQDDGEQSWLGIRIGKLQTSGRLTCGNPERQTNSPKRVSNSPPPTAFGHKPLTVPAMTRQTAQAAIQR
jgi:hypothetical protein